MPVSLHTSCLAQWFSTIPPHLAPACLVAQVQVSSQASGFGLFSIADASPGMEIPVKGPWFRSLPELEAFLGRHHEDTATMMSTRVVRVDLEQDKESQEDPASSQGQVVSPASVYKLITSPVGFVNHFTRLSNQPNFVLVWKEGAPLSEHNLVLKCTKPIKQGKEWLLNYGPLHQVVEKTTRKRKRQSTPGPVKK